ncbi:MAG: flavodoxin-dependent (E)-4-hydroxy-3-methylbut-2-enyl-diphosphate synthase [Clostridia bacterium]|nr:flavodoxin-dependent (E)-4-hydroxy-3-methylbut-2-enyl-diphosphate synthase [Clostridia bacterium]
MTVKKMKKEVKIGNIKIGGTNKVAVQSMTNTKTGDVQATVNQIKELEIAGCEIIRVTVPDIETAKVIDKIKERISIPLVADIHFDYRAALECIDRGIDKVRINPGNIGDESRVKAVAQAAKQKNIPIRIGVNGGSLDKDIMAKYGEASAEAMVESALKEIACLEKYDFDNIVLSLKASDVKRTVEAYRLISRKCNYPLHVGVTEAGSEYSGLVKSSVGIGSLLLDGIGDTIRVSLTADPVKEIYAAQEILKSCGLVKKGVSIVSCPTCGRCNYNLIPIVNELEKRVRNINKEVKVAVMGCVVNGPGEAKDADMGVAGGLNECVFFKKGVMQRKIPFDNVVEEIMKEIENY